MTPRSGRTSSRHRTSRIATLTATVVGIAAAGPSQAWVGWRQLAPAVAPSARAAHVLVHDAARSRMVLFGGSTNTGAGCCALADTWEWNGAVWSLRQPSAVPPPRAGAAATWDSRRERIVLFGGSDGASFLADTWEWDGTDWTQRAPSTSPPPRMLGGAAFDALHGETILFGGYDGSTHLDDTWVWDGSLWTQRAVAVRPAPRKQAAMVYDAAAGVTVLFGGERQVAMFDDTWIWDGVQWSPRTPGTAPPSLWASAAGFDPVRGRVVMSGGFGFAGTTDDVWEWDGITWHLHGVTQAPSPRQNAALAFWPTGEGLLLGGLTAAGAGALGDSWGFRGAAPASFARYGNGCAGTAGTPSLDRHPTFAWLPWIGTTFGLRVANLPSTMPPFVVLGISDTVHQGQALPLDLGALGMPGCWLLTSVEFVGLGTPDGSGATLLLTLPPAGRLLGARFFGQALVFDPAANPLGATTSNAVQAVVGSR